MGRGLRSVVNWLYAELLKSFKAVFHGFERLRRVPLPIRDLAYNPQRLTRAARLRRIAPKLLIRQIGVIFDRAGRFHDVNSAGTLTDGQLRSPGGLHPQYGSD